MTRPSTGRMLLLAFYPDPSSSGSKQPPSPSSPTSAPQNSDLTLVLTAPSEEEATQWLTVFQQFLLNDEGALEVRAKMKKQLAMSELLKSNSPVILNVRAGGRNKDEQVRRRKRRSMFGSKKNKDTVGYEDDSRASEIMRQVQHCVCSYMCVCVCVPVFFVCVCVVFCVCMRVFAHVYVLVL